MTSNNNNNIRTIHDINIILLNNSIIILLNITILIFVKAFLLYVIVGFSWEYHTNVENLYSSILIHCNSLFKGILCAVTMGRGSPDRLFTKCPEVPFLNKQACLVSVRMIRVASHCKVFGWNGS